MFEDFLDEIISLIQENKKSLLIKTIGIIFIGTIYIAFFNNKEEPILVDNVGVEYDSGSLIVKGSPQKDSSKLIANVGIANKTKIITNSVNIDLEEKISKLKNEIPKLNEEIPKLEEEIIELRRLNLKLDENEAPRLKDKITDLEDKIDKIKEKIPKLEEEVIELEKLKDQEILTTDPTTTDSTTTDPTTTDPTTTDSTTTDPTTTDPTTTDPTTTDPTTTDPTTTDPTTTDPTTTDPTTTDPTITDLNLVDNYFDNQVFFDIGGGGLKEVMVKVKIEERPIYPLPKACDVGYSKLGVFSNISTLTTLNIPYADINNNNIYFTNESYYDILPSTSYYYKVININEIKAGYITYKTTNPDITNYWVFTICIKD